MNYLNALFQLAFPRACEGCGLALRSGEDLLCLRCTHELPVTYYQFYSANPVEKLFWGRIPVAQATAQYYFTKGSVIQHLMHQFKYRNNQELGHTLGRLVGESLRSTNRFTDIDALIPLPLNRVKEHKRGFNQAAVLCKGMSEVMLKPVYGAAVKRIVDTETQTKKNREERWNNIKGKFAVCDRPLISHKHLLLVDDVITTGATLEACGHELLQVEGTQLSIAALCISSRT